MNEEEKNHFEELLVKAVQAGKKETSDLVDMISHRMEEKIESTIVKVVNGKVDKIHTKMEEWEPIIKNMEKTQNFFSVGGTIFRAVVLIGATATAIISLTKWFK